MIRRHHSTVYTLAACLLLAACFPAAAQTPIQVLGLDRHAFYRGEEIAFQLRWSETIGKARLELDVGGCFQFIQEIEPGPGTFECRIPTAKLKAGQYQISGQMIAETTTHTIPPIAFTLAMPPHPDRLLIWLWGGGGSPWYLDHGFTTLTGIYGVSPEKTFSEDDRSALDQGLPTGAAMGIFANGGLRDIDPATLADPDATFNGVRSHEKTPIANPYHPEIARIQNETNQRIMEFARDYPQLKTAFFNTEVVDSLDINRNKGGLQALEQAFGANIPQPGPPKLVEPGVLADDDPSYLLHKFLFKTGNGLTIANQRTAEMIHRYRPDVLTITDPYRQTALLDMFPGLDVISTWTYTNPDPKLMLYIETLLAVCKPTGQIPLHTITLLNYPGELTPGEEWTLMGPDCLKETTWINLSRAPKILGYYYSSACDPQHEQNERVPYATSLAIRELSQNVFKPLGPMITRLQVAPRRIAVLSSAAARLHGTSPRLRSGYDNYQIYHFYTLLAMNHLNADVVFDETIERFGLDDYDTLALPKCDLLTESVFREVQRFAQRGGVLIADQYLGPGLPGVHKFDFDFTYRERVSAKAVAENKIFAQWNDQLQPDSAELKQAQGVTALDDQRIMEAYAARLKEGLRGIVEPAIRCDQPTILLNRLEYEGGQYLAVINDKREYDDRIGQYKGMLGKLVPQVGCIEIDDWPHETLVVYDLIARKALRVEKREGTFSFRVPLGELGGTFLALEPQAFADLKAELSAPMASGQPASLVLTVRDTSGNRPRGLQPMRVDFISPTGESGDYSGWYCAEHGELRLDFVPAVNDATGPWSVKAEDLTSGISVTASFEFVHSSSQ